MTTARSDAPAQIGEMPFEKALEQLEEIVRRLERGDVPLDESVEIYERGEALKRHCEALLKKAEVRIQRITLTPDGRPDGTAPLDVE
ncbi:exodeoxyribonuclease VII small subunit [Methylobacterium trifolii]|uniref:Exodeoxyribonuclease 7 small subunit n=1 Tax=Methylobacterium trifolii TaxID=1003092 RepID=A0ABQ4U674_9HYPH|nr:exodeoxyribonuclease VII small subunit [Methylobacterium trifolii]GJE62672.1 Exodeoxyribonuclease 7 small subunit [Methylobacterium trifolii]